ncbi:MAG TPA: type II toxin-antitoxin system RelE/ParE family toxin [Thiohalobacter sp.]|nr:type II toxin-antitoxin system RelE/ParE family toxin [Thiohalobacter sp.]
MKIITVNFYQTGSGVEPVKEWLKGLDREIRKIIGDDIKTVEFGWPLGMPLVRKLDQKLWEVRSDISDGRIARVIFTVCQQRMVLLHGFIKKSQKTPKTDLETGKQRRDEVQHGSK